MRPRLPSSEHQRYNAQQHQNPCDAATVSQCRPIASPSREHPVTSDAILPDMAAQASLPPPPQTPVPGHAPLPVARSTVRDTWGWLWKDTLGRVVPFFAGAALYARLSGRGARGLGLTRDGWIHDVLLGTAVGLPMTAVAIAFRRWEAPRYRLPTPADQVFQSAFYFLLNAPAEELLWRGTVQTAAIAALARVPRLRPAAPVLGWAFATASFGVYHRLGNWSWRSIAGVTVAGGLFGALYLTGPRRGSILAPTIVHGFATAGFLSWGDAALHLLAQRSAT